MTSAPTVAQLWEVRWRPWVFVAAAVVVSAVSLAEGGFRPVDWSLLPFAVLGFVAKAQRPELSDLVVAIPALLVALVINIVGTEVEFAMFLPVLATLLLAAQEPNRLVVAGFVTTAVVAVFVLSVTGVYDWAWTNWIMALLLAAMFGTLAFNHQEAIVELESTRARMVDQAALVERRRIARDVHDLVGHSLSVVLLHVAGARRLLRSDPDEAEAALLEAEDAGRESMVEVRRAVALMRDDGEAEAAMPTPDLADIATMVERYRNAGLDVYHQAAGPLDEVDGARAVACYRIAQEALANATKHAPGSTVEVTVDVSDEACVLRVVNRGGSDGRDDTSVSAPAEQSGHGHGHGHGHGLIGMRERAVSSGGSLIAGPIPGGWSVEVSFPRRVDVRPGNQW